MLNFLSKYVGDVERFFAPAGLIMLLLMSVSMVVGLYGTAIFTELGQLLNFPREWMLHSYKNQNMMNALIVLSAIIILVLQFSAGKIFKPGFIGLYGFGMVACLFFINMFAPDVWLRSQHHDAQFASIEKIGGRLNEDEDVFVLEINGDARAYPRDWMQVPHIAGDNIGGTEAVVTYCALSNVPVAFDSTLNGQEADFKVIAQVNNNLIFADENSGEMIQQVTGTAEYSQTQLNKHPVQRMPYGSFKQLYPQGKVFDYNPNLLDRVTMWMFDTFLVDHYEGQNMFPTLSLHDQRLPNGEQIWGLNVNDQQMAVTLSGLEKQPRQIVELGGKKILLVWFSELETLGAFDANAALSEEDIAQVDAYGHIGDKSLARVNTYPGMLWMVWSHWFPETEVL